MRGFRGGPAVRNLPCNARDKGSIPGQGTKIPGGNFVQQSPTQPNKFFFFKEYMRVPLLFLQLGASSLGLGTSVG